MNSFNSKYSNLIGSKNFINPDKAERGRFYIIKEYITVDNKKENYSEAKAPIIFTLFVSKKKDVLHAIKLSDVNPNTIAKLFEKLLDKETEEVKIVGSAKKLYKDIVSKVPKITDDGYRTYKLSGIKKMIELEMYIDELIPKNKKK